MSRRIASLMAVAAILAAPLATHAVPNDLDEFETTKIVNLGDSITLGIMVFPPALGPTYTQIMDSRFGPLPVVNGGCAGASSFTYLNSNTGNCGWGIGGQVPAEFLDAEVDDTTLVNVLIGGGDATRFPSATLPNVFEDNMETLVSELQARGAHLIILWNSVHMNVLLPDPLPQAFLDAYDPIIEGIANASATDNVFYAGPYGDIGDILDGTCGDQLLSTYGVPQATLEEKIGMSPPASVCGDDLFMSAPNVHPNSMAHTVLGTWFTWVTLFVECGFNWMNCPAP